MVFVPHVGRPYSMSSCLSKCLVFRQDIAVTFLLYVKIEAVERVNDMVMNKGNDKKMRISCLTEVMFYQK